MNRTLLTRIKVETPVIESINEKEANIYKGALTILAAIVSDEFIDMPALKRGAIRPNTDGLCYSIPFLDSPMLASSSNNRDLLVVWQTQNGGSDCPLRISVTLTTPTEYAIHVHDQSGQRTITRDLYARMGDSRTTEIKGYDNLTLSELLTLNKGQA